MTPEARARIRAVWATLAGVESFPRHGLLVTVNDASRVCPPGWAGVVGLDAGVVVVVPRAELVDSFTRVLDASAGRDWSELARAAGATDALGPARLAYAERVSFVPAPGAGPVDLLHTGSLRVERFVASVPEADASEAGVLSCTSPLFCAVDGDRVVAAAGYRVWIDEIAHLAVLVAPARRGEGLARAVASAATAHALANGLLAQWRAVPPASQRVATALGYEPVGRQVSLQIP